MSSFEAGSIAITCDNELVNLEVKVLLLKVQENQRSKNSS
jgi:hypothetical protein